MTVTLVVLIQFVVAFFFYKDPYKEALKLAKRGHTPLDKDKPYLASCLVAVFNEEKIIRKCVESICSQSYPHKEIIFINDRSTDRTGEVLDELAREFPIKVIHLEKNRGKKAALCEGIYVSKGEIIAMTDSDSVWLPEALARSVEVFRYHANVGGLSGYTRALNGDRNFITRIQDSWYEGQYSIRKAFESTFGVVSCVSGPLAVFRRDAIYNYLTAWEKDQFLGQEFRFATDRTMTGFVLGAPYVGQKIKAKYPNSLFSSPDYPIKDYKIVFTKAARALTVVPDTFGSMIKQQVRWKKSFIRNTFFTGGFYWREPLLPMLAYYLHTVFVLAGPFIVLRHVIYLPLQGEYYTFVLYITGIIFVGFMFGLAFKLENPSSHKWIYRPFMSLMSALVLCWLIFYSAVTIRKMLWHRD